MMTLLAQGQSRVAMSRSGGSVGHAGAGYTAAMSTSAARVLPRVLGVLTAAYSVAIIVSPKLLAKPCKLTRADGVVPPEVATVIRAVGVRDAASGLALVTAPAGAALRAAVAVRVVSDFGDAAVFGLTLPDATTKAKAAGVAAAWGTLCAYSGRHTG